MVEDNASGEPENSQNNGQTAGRNNGIQNILPHRWKKGQSGNMKGRPLGARSRATIVREWLECLASDGEDGTISDQLVRKLILKANEGDTTAFKELFDSAYGKNTETQEIKQTGDLNLNITRKIVRSENGNND